MAEEVEILRESGDEYLLINPPGQTRMDFCHKISAPMAESMTKYPGLKSMVRVWYYLLNTHSERQDFYIIARVQSPIWWSHENLESHPTI